MKTLNDLFIHELKDLYRAADGMHQVFKRMSSAATHPELVQMLDTYYTQTERQKKKLQEFFTAQSIEIDDTDSPVSRKIQDHGRASMRYEGSKEIRDLALLLSVEIMKHFEVTAFGTLLTHADRLKREDMTDLLLSLKKKIGEEEQKPLHIASRLLDEGDKKETQDLFSTILKAQVRDEQQLLSFLPDLIAQASSSTLKEALETYQSEHKAAHEKLKEIDSERQNGSEINEWSVINAYTTEWKQDLSAIESPDLKDIGIILSVQRMQHLNMALYAFENLLAKHLEGTEEEKTMELLHDQELGNDQSFTAIAEGSLFNKGLDAKVNP